MRKTRCGAALVVTLALLTLLSIIVVSFISITTGDLAATRNYTRVQQASEIAQDGLAKVVSQLLAEIIDSGRSSSSTVGGYTIYTPLAPADAVPQPMIPGLSTNLATIVKMSTNGVPFFTTTSKSALVSSLASPVSTLAASANARGVSVARWNAPRLMSSTNRFPVPNWVFVTRGGPLFLPAGTSPREAGLSPSGGGGSNVVLGRYAYVVYDTSGLLDANASGFPQAASSSASVKGIAPWADLTQLAPGTLTTNDVNSLVLWRNASHAGDYATYVTNWSLNGFMRVAPGDTAFLSRQELIAYAEKQNPHLSGALPYLTTFSRELDSPSWGPLTNVQSAGSYAYQANANASASTNRFFPNVRVAVPFMRRDNTKAFIGEPLVKYRFPLSKLSLLAKTVGPPNALSTADKAAIKSYFGLIPDPSSSGYYRKWIYTNPLGAGVAASILTLDQISGREPDFFELLQAGILAGSLGKSGRTDDGPASGTLVDTDPTPSYQIIRIGANIIDQWHTDNYPTTIAFNGYDCYGTADLPYVNQMFAKIWNPNGLNIPSATSSQPLVYYLYPQMWNPHQSPATDYGSTPTSFRLAFATNDCWWTQLIASSTAGARSRWGWLPAGNASGSWVGNPPTTYFTASANAAYYPPLQFNSGSIQTAFREPGFVTNSMVTSTNVLNDAAGLGTTVVGGWKVATVSVPLSSTPAQIMDYAASPATWGAQTQYGWSAKWFLSLQMQLQYLDASGNYRTYATFVGSPSTVPSVVTGVSDQTYYGGPTNTATLAGSAFLKSDPRTSRFGACLFLQGLPGSVLYNTNNNAAGGLVSSPSTVYGYSSSYYPKFFPGGVYRPDVLAINDTTVPLQGNVTTSASYADPDGATRYGDGRQAYPKGYSPFYTNSVSATSGTMVRPVILHRPFVSVAEMGYAFRDAPWKTLDFCSTSSADGGLLDLFSLNDEAPLSAYGAPVVAGRVNPNTPYPQVLAALLAGQQSNPFPGTTPISSSGAWTEAQAIVASTGSQPVISRADLALRIASLLGNGIPSSTGIKVDQEAPIRALASVANVRTWNLLIDVIAQAGKYPPTATDLSQFTVEGERRYWLHIAIDRYTGKIVDQQIEIVSQ